MSASKTPRSNGSRPPIFSEKTATSARSRLAGSHSSAYTTPRSISSSSSTCSSTPLRPLNSRNGSQRAADAVPPLEEADGGEALGAQLCTAIALLIHAHDDFDKRAKHIKTIVDLVRKGARLETVDAKKLVDYLQSALKTQDERVTDVLSLIEWLAAESLDTIEECRKLVKPLLDAAIEQRIEINKSKNVGFKKAWSALIHKLGKLEGTKLMLEHLRAALDDAREDESRALMILKLYKYVIIKDLLPKKALTLHEGLNALFTDELVKMWSKESKKELEQRVIVIANAISTDVEPKALCEALRLCGSRYAQLLEQLLMVSAQSEYAGIDSLYKKLDEEIEEAVNYYGESDLQGTVERLLYYRACVQDRDEKKAANGDAKQPSSLTEQFWARVAASKHGAVLMQLMQQADDSFANGEAFQACSALVTDVKQLYGPQLAVIRQFNLESSLWS